MPNDYFQFKEFIIRQDKCAMKVCTDSCLFGAWMIQKIKDQKRSHQHVLDIGSGTGLLSLMYAQNFNSAIDLIEIDRQAFIQAIDNIQLTPWKDRLTLFNRPLQAFSPSYSYDFIFSNPPFYENNLPSIRENEKAAKHSSELLLDEILDFASVHLKPEGSMAIMLPYNRMNDFQKKASDGDFIINDMMLVKHNPNKNYFRVFFMLSKVAYKNTASDIIICDDDHIYTESFKELLKPYYLAL